MNNRIKMVREALRTPEGKKYSQSRFAEELLVTRDMIATYENGRVIPTDLFIARLCDLYNVNKSWLETGEGEMFKPKTREQEIAEITREMYESEDEYTLKIMNLLIKADSEELELIYELLNKIIKEANEKKPLN